MIFKKRRKQPINPYEQIQRQALSAWQDYLHNEKTRGNVRRAIGEDIRAIQVADALFLPALDGCPWGEDDRTYAEQHRGGLVTLPMESYGYSTKKGPL
jgi:hypothetical protein